jgi:hypothetical protein
MGMRTKFLCLIAGSLLGAQACADQWFTVNAPSQEVDRAMVEVDLETVRVRGNSGDGVIRISFDALQSHSAGFSYRSFLANVQFDCQRRVITLTSATYFGSPGGKGQRLGTDSAGKEAGMPPGLLETIPSAARQALLKAACATTQTSAA